MSIKNDNPGRFTHSLKLLYHDDHNLHHVISLILNMPSLRLFTSLRPIGGGELSALAQASHSSLERLGIRLDGTLSFSLAIGTLTHFSRLRRLVLVITAEDVEPSSNNPQPITLPELAELDWCAHGPAHVEALHCLSACTLPMLRKMLLKLPDLQGCRGPLKQFFEAHKQLDKLSLNLPWNSLSEFLAIDIDTKHLEFTNCVPPANAITQHLPSTVDTLSVRASYQANAIWMLLSAILLSENINLKAVHVTTVDTFTWDAGSRSEPMATFVGKMVYNSLELQKKGILLVDEAGKTIRECMG